MNPTPLILSVDKTVSFGSGFLVKSWEKIFLTTARHVLMEVDKTLKWQTLEITLPWHDKVIWTIKLQVEKIFWNPKVDAAAIEVRLEWGKIKAI